MTLTVHFHSCWNYFTEDNLELQWLPQTGSFKTSPLQLLLFLLPLFTTSNLPFSCLESFDCLQALPPLLLCLLHFLFFFSLTFSYSHLSIRFPVPHWELSRGSVQFSCSVVSNSLRPHGLQHARPPCPSPTPGVYSNSCPLSRWCHLIISSSVIPFSSCLQSSPASGSFQMSQFFASGGQGIRVSASTSVLPMNIQGWLPLGWTGWISLQSKGLSRVFSNTTVQKHQYFGTQLSLYSNSHIHT